MCRISRHTTLLLSGIASLECRVVKMANQGTGSLFIDAEILAKLARCSYLILWVTPRPTFVKVVEGCVIFNFAIDRKVHYSLEIQRKTILNNASANCFHPATPERAPKQRRARATPACRTRAARARRGTGGPSSPCAAPRVLLLVTFASAWTAPSGLFPLAGVPTTARHWATAPPHVAAPCCPRRACTGDVVDPTTP
jgi:hypothetical protein